MSSKYRKKTLEELDCTDFFYRSPNVSRTYQFWDSIRPQSNTTVELDHRLAVNMNKMKWELPLPDDADIITSESRKYSRQQLLDDWFNPDP